MTLQDISMVWAFRHKSMIQVYGGTLYLAYLRDKRRSVSREWRTPEKRLLTLAIVGGWPAAKLAQRMLRHKTRKQPFAWHLNLIGVAWGWALTFLVAAAMLTPP